MSSNLYQYFSFRNVSGRCTIMLYLLVTPNSFNSFFISPVKVFILSLKVSLYQSLGDWFFQIVVYSSDQSPGKLPVKEYIL